jgi:hypothetical protein
MTPWYRTFIYLFTLPWDLVTWLIICFMRLCWGENLKWERDVDAHGSPVLTCDLKPNSWPARTWYTYKVGGKKQPVHPSLQERYGEYRTWGGTTLGPHAIFYGPGRRPDDQWAPIQKHEHIHTEQGEAYMLLSFMYALPFFIYGLVTHSVVVWVMALASWTLGYVFMYTNFLIAILRGEPAYRGSHHEESAYSQMYDK